MLIKFVKFVLLILSVSFLTFSCRMPESFGFWQPITLTLEAPDGPPEYKAGWHAGCKSALAYGAFANAKAYGNVDFGTGVYQHDPMYQTGWGQAWFACVTHIGDFVEFHSFMKGPLE